MPCQDIGHHPVEDRKPPKRINIENDGVRFLFLLYQSNVYREQNSA